MAQLSARTLGILWVCYGVMHFSAHDEAVRQMPAYFPWKSEIVYVTGVAELVVGVGLCLPSLRAPAAWGAIALLALFLPAVLHIIVHDVVPRQWPQGLRVFMRWFVLPHNVLFGWWAYHFTRRDSP